METVSNIEKISLIDAVHFERIQIAKDKLKELKKGDIGPHEVLTNTMFNENGKIYNQVSSVDTTEEIENIKLEFLNHDAEQLIKKFIQSELDKLNKKLSRKQFVTVNNLSEHKVLIVFMEWGRNIFSDGTFIVNKTGDLVYKNNEYSDCVQSLIDPGYSHRFNIPCRDRQCSIFFKNSKGWKCYQFDSIDYMEEHFITLLESYRHKKSST